MMKKWKETRQILPWGFGGYLLLFIQIVNELVPKLMHGNWEPTLAECNSVADLGFEKRRVCEWMLTVFNR